MSKREELYNCKQQAMKLMDRGYTRQEANEQSGLNYSKSGILHLYREWKKRGDEALADKRQGHAYKVTNEVQEWLVERCQNDPEAYAPQLVAEIKAEFEVELHHDYVNLLRKQLGLAAPKPGRPGQKGSKQPAGGERFQEDFPPISTKEQADCNEGPKVGARRCEAAGAYLVWGEMVKSEAWAVLSSSLERVVAAKEKGEKLTGMSSQAAREDHLSTVLLMPALGLLKPCRLEAYSGTVLGQLSRRERPYSGSAMNHFILSCVRLDWVEPLTAEVARWATQLWADAPANDILYRYWDWHVKTVYSDYALPRSKHGTSQRIVCARKQLMLHDQAGHLLLMKTYRGDTNLIEGMLRGTAYYEGLMKSRRLSHQIFDREGLSVAHFKALQQEPQRQFITYLRSNQYDGVESFDEATPFEPFRYDRRGQVIQEIAEAQYKLKDRRRGEEDLPVRAILGRKPKVEGSDEAPKLRVNVTLDQELEADEVARLYQARKVVQENAIRDWWNPLGGEVNIGYVKQAVENSELAKDKAEVEKRLESLANKLVAVQKRLQKAQQKQQWLTEQYLTALSEVQQKLRLAAQSEQVIGEATSYPWGQAEKLRLEAELADLYQQLETAGQKVEQELAKDQRYQQEEAEKRESLTKISQAMVEKPMYQLDDRQDQLMGALRTCLTNVLQHLREAVFPTSYAKATYNTLANFITMGGYIIEQPQYIEVILDGFWQADKRRDLAELVAHCNERQYTAPDGRPLRFGICQVPGYI